MFKESFVYSLKLVFGTTIMVDDPYTFAITLEFIFDIKKSGNQKPTSVVAPAAPVATVVKKLLHT
jgi:hypothetical protein